MYILLCSLDWSALQTGIRADKKDQSEWEGVIQNSRLEVEDFRVSV